MFRSRSWFGGGWGRPKNPHSLEHLKYLYNVLSRNQTVSEHNRGLLVETLRSIAEILIWGDQNDSSVFDFFLEKNMLSFFLRIMRQRSGGSSFVCVQLLQTLNILFENIRNETSLYYLLSNNHVNSIIVHKFDFSDEEVMAYYISFLKTLSLKLNAHTIHFFYNEHTNDFPLYTEAIKFFNHPESMVRIAVRTLTLNVYKVEDASMLAFIRDRTAAPYFSNIVWFIGKHIQELDVCVRNDADHQSQNRLSDLVAEHLDHLHYLNDILCLNITDLNQVLTDHLLHKLLIPLYIYSLSTVRKPTGGVEAITKALNQKLNLNESSSNGGIPHEPSTGKVSCVVALFLLSQVCLIISHSPVVQTVAWIVLKSDRSIYDKGVEKLLEAYENEMKRNGKNEEASGSESSFKDDVVEEHKNITDEEKQRLATTPTESESVSEKPFLETVYNALDCSENDYAALFALILLYAMAYNKGIMPDINEQVLRPKKTYTSKTSSRDVRYTYNTYLVDKLLYIVLLSCQPSCRVRLVTLELALKLLVQLVMADGKSVLLESHKSTIESAKTQSTALLRNFYKSEEIFLDMFEHEYCDMSKTSLNVEWLCMDSAILLPPTGTPMTGIDFTKRLPCGEQVERARRAIRVFFLVRNVVLTLNGEMETQLPLTNPQSCVQIDQALDLSISRYNSDLIACTVLWKDGTKTRRFLVIDVLQLILVEPDTKRLGWGVAKLVGFLQDIEVTGDKDDSRCLHITIHRPLSGTTTNRVPLLSAKFVFDDNIRCMAAKQRLTKGRIKARQKKMQHIARLLEIPGQSGPPSPAFVGGGIYNRSAGRGLRDRPFGLSRGPGFATPRWESPPGVTHRTDESRRHRDSDPKNLKKDDRTPNRSRDSSSSRTKSREGSPRMPRPRSEEIPLELIKKASNSVIDMTPKIAIVPRPQLKEESEEVEKKPEEEVSISSEETSFIASERRNSKKGGNIETV
ncbi:protein CLEC16A homolog isoform X1 [Tribolium madens]|uniref:protein CLEC16A homolog isoform X1 n=1 Tax=Tribolium madens TaxID=41895 RepID=UPI001CF746B7|nr:protein CLEC16A homolog isoform X1 [Tribolium madens]